MRGRRRYLNRWVQRKSKKVKKIKSVKTDKINIDGGRKKSTQQKRTKKVEIFEK
jgi:hypothetical protein